MSELKPCPFCGGEAKISMKYVGYGSLGLGAHDWFGVYCADCDTSTREHQTEAEAIAAWNRRASGWVKCSERLPEEPYGCLLMVDEDDYFGGVHNVLLPYFAGYDGDGWNDGDGERVPFEVTHWMPLPEPPEVDE